MIGGPPHDLEEDVERGLAALLQGEDAGAGLVEVEEGGDAADLRGVVQRGAQQVVDEVEGGALLEQPGDGVEALVGGQVGRRGDEVQDGAALRQRDVDGGDLGGGQEAREDVDGGGAGGVHELFEDGVAEAEARGGDGDGAEEGEPDLGVVRGGGRVDGVAVREKAKRGGGGGG